MHRLLSVCLSVCLGVLRAHYTPLQRYMGKLGKCFTFVHLCVYTYHTWKSEDGLYVNVKLHFFIYLLHGIQLWIQTIYI